MKKDIQREMIQYLQRIISEGKHWVTLKKDKVPKTPFDLKAFKSAIDADRFCQKYIWAQDRLEKQNSPHEVFTSASNMLMELQFNRTGIIQPLTSLSLLKEQLLAADIHFTDMSRHEELYSLLAIGGTALGFKVLPVRPEENFSKFLIITDTYLHDVPGRLPGRLEAKVVGSSNDLLQANLIMEKEAGKMMAANVSEGGIHILAQLPGIHPEFNHRCEILRNTALEVGLMRVGQGKLLSHAVWEKGEEIKVHQSIYLRFNAETGHVQHLDDQLRLININQTATSYGSIDFTEVLRNELTQAAKVTLRGSKAHRPRKFQENATNNSLKP